jgi:monothiol glutaredoxin
MSEPSELSKRIKQTIESEDVVVFMKGTPERVFCGNSARALDALRTVDAPVAAVDVLPDPSIRAELSALSSWPTIPQVFVRGELVGGADIVEELAATGELREKLDSALGEGWSKRPREERVVEVAERPSPFRLAR